MQSEAFFREFSGERGAWAELDLVDVLARARQPWPEVDVPDEAFLTYLGGRVDASADPARELTALHLSDLYLACGCALGQPAAVSTFVARYLSEVPRYLGRLDPAGRLADDVRQELSQKFLVAAPPDPPRISSYSGRGPLSAWVAIAAQRVALRHLEGGKRDVAVGNEPLERLITGTRTPELLLAKAHLREEFRTAIRAAIDELSSRERMLLRLSVVSGLGCRKVAELYGVNHATVARWLAKVRESLFSSVQAHLQRRGIDPEDLSSMLGLARSEIDLSLSGLLEA
jgi:RNA polymerase sigma-70 factor (ECF subfamily)